jgi:hypothetical protein
MEDVGKAKRSQRWRRGGMGHQGERQEKSPHEHFLQIAAKAKESIKNTGKAAKKESKVGNGAYGRVVALENHPKVVRKVAATGKSILAGKAVEALKREAENYRKLKQRMCLTGGSSSFPPPTKCCSLFAHGQLASDNRSLLIAPRGVDLQHFLTETLRDFIDNKEITDPVERGILRAVQKTPLLAFSAKAEPFPPLQCAWKTACFLILRLHKMLACLVNRKVGHNDLKPQNIIVYVTERGSLEIAAVDVSELCVDNECKPQEWSHTVGYYRYWNEIDNKFYKAYNQGIEEEGAVIHICCDIIDAAEKWSKDNNFKTAHVLHLLNFKNRMKKITGWEDDQGKLKYSKSAPTRKLLSQCRSLYLEMLNKAFDFLK